MGGCECHGLPCAWIILCMHPANERRRYNVTSSLIGWAHEQNDDPCMCVCHEIYLYCHQNNLNKAISVNRFGESYSPTIACPLCKGSIDVHFWGNDSTQNYCQLFNIRRTSVGNKIVDHSDVVGALPVSTAPTTSSFSTWHLDMLDWAKTTVRRDEKHLSLGIWCAYIRDFTVNVNPVHETEWAGSKVI